MVFQEGHEYSKKLKTDELKREAYKQYCDHIASGYPKKSWCLRHPDITLTWETMEKYIREEPSIFDPVQKTAAQADALKLAFQPLWDSARGRNKDANVASLQIILRNMHAWDAKDHHSEDKEHHSQAAQEMVLKQLKTLQDANRSNASDAEC